MDIVVVAVVVLEWSVCIEACFGAFQFSLMQSRRRFMNESSHCHDTLIVFRVDAKINVAFPLPLPLAWHSPGRGV